MDVHENLFLSLANCLSFNGHSVVILHGYNTYQGRGRDCEKEFHSTEAMMECITGYRWDTNPEFKCQSLLFPQTTHRRVPNQTLDLHTLLNSMSFFCPVCETLWCHINKKKRFPGPLMYIYESRYEMIRSWWLIAKALDVKRQGIVLGIHLLYDVRLVGHLETLGTVSSFVKCRLHRVFFSSFMGC